MSLLAISVALIGFAISKKITNSPIPATLVAASFLTIPYAQFAFSRADLNHLAQGIFPLLIGCLVFISNQPAKIKWPIVILIFISTVWVMVPVQPSWQCRQSEHCVKTTISGNYLIVNQSVASDIELLQKLISLYASNNQSFIAAPLWPGAYALANRRSPTWETFPLFARPMDFEQLEIARIIDAHPSFAIIVDLALDGQDALRYKNTHPHTYQYILNNFKLVNIPANQNYEIYVANGWHQ